MVEQQVFLPLPFLVNEQDTRKEKIEEVDLQEWRRLEEEKEDSLQTQEEAWNETNRQHFVQRVSFEQNSLRFGLLMNDQC